MGPTLKSWIPATHSDYDRLMGKDVYTRDGENLGTVKLVDHPDKDLPLVGADHSILIDTHHRRKWFNDLDEVYVPETEIVGIGDDRIMLSFTADHVKEKDWTGEAVIASRLGITSRE